jgi:hypothetical protein
VWVRGAGLAGFDGAEAGGEGVVALLPRVGDVLAVEVEPDPGGGRRAGDLHGEGVEDEVVQGEDSVGPALRVRAAP